MASPKEPSPPAQPKAHSRSPTGYSDAKYGELHNTESPNRSKPRVKVTLKDVRQSGQFETPQPSKKKVLDEPSMHDIIMGTAKAPTYKYISPQEAMDRKRNRSNESQKFLKDQHLPA